MKLKRVDIYMPLANQFVQLNHSKSMFQNWIQIVWHCSNILKIAGKDAEFLDVGLNTFTMKMKVISVKAGLSRVYTNHSIRATS